MFAQSPANVKAMDEKQFARQLALLRKEAGKTQEEMAAALHVSPQAVSKWENGHSLPETALLPDIARLLDVSIDQLFNPGSLRILEASFGDGMAAVSVTKRLNRLIENDALEGTVSAALLGARIPEERVCFLTVKYQSAAGPCHRAFLEGEALCLTGADRPDPCPEAGLEIMAGRYGTRRHHYDVRPKIEHYKPFDWNAYPANHETFPSDPANDDTEYLTLVYRNRDGLHMATCAEGEALAYSDDRTRLIRQYKGEACYIPNVPVMPPFGKGMECSWAAALTAALRARGAQTTYAEVMGVSGACYRLAFCSPGWDYSAVDGLVAYDYATPGFAAFGYTPVQYCRIEKADRAEHRRRIMKEIRNNMPILGINLRVAPEWGVICGYAKAGEDLFCRTKYDAEVTEQPDFVKGSLNPYDYLFVDNWPFLLCYFDGKRKPPTPEENLAASLRTFSDCAEKPRQGGYFLGFQAYEAWARDLRDDAFYETCGDEQMARRFSVNQFCMLALQDARQAAHAYLSGVCAWCSDALVSRIAERFKRVADLALDAHRMLDSGMALDGPRSRAFWTLEKRRQQADMLEEMAEMEREALTDAKAFLSRRGS